MCARWVHKNHPPADEISSGRVIDVMGVYFDVYKRSKKFRVYMSWLVNHRPGGTIGGHSLSHAHSGVPAPSGREPEWVRTVQPGTR